MAQDARETQHADVLVVGGGVAGFAASVAAAAAGARTLLLERADVLGGVVTQADVHTFCGLFEPRPEDRFIYANPGFAPWFAEGLKRAGGALEPQVHGKVGVLPIFPPRVGDYAWEVARLFPTLTVSFESTLTGLERGSSQRDPWIASYRRNGRAAEVRASIAIDASGDAIAGELAGAELLEPKSKELQHATLIFRVSGAVAADLGGHAGFRLSAKVARAARTGELPISSESVTIRPGESPDEAYISLNLPKSDESAYSPLDPDFMQSYTDEAHDSADAVIGYLANHVPGWQDCALLAWPLRIGVRETRTIVGHYVLNELDITKGQRFPDAVCRSSWPIELWHSHRGADFRYPDAVADVPLRALVSRSLPNLGMAGRCMSGTHAALGALRVTGTAMASGEAVGLAAAIAVEDGAPLAAVAADAVRARRAALIEEVFPQP